MALRELGEGRAAGREAAPERRAEGPWLGRPRRRISRPRQVGPLEVESLSPGCSRGSGGVERKPSASSRAAKPAPPGISGEGRPVSPAPRPRTSVHSRPPQGTAAEHGGGPGRPGWKRTHSPSPEAQTSRAGRRGGGGGGEAASDSSDTAPAISFYYPSLQPNTQAGRGETPLCPRVPPAPLTPQCPAKFPFSPCVHLAGPVPMFNSLQRGVTDVTWRNESRISSLNCLVLHPFKTLKTV